jgi:hypothetical protein
MADRLRLSIRIACQSLTRPRKPRREQLNICVAHDTMCSMTNEQQNQNLYCRIERPSEIGLRFWPGQKIQSTMLELRPPQHCRSHTGGLLTQFFESVGGRQVPQKKRS